VLKHAAGSDPAPVSIAHIVQAEIQVLGSRGGSLDEAMAEIASGRVDVAPLVARRVRLEDAESAMKSAARREHLRVVFEI
jgi:threonine dehydrogenase-like Zn-dependent dehydrogenase